MMKNYYLQKLQYSFGFNPNIPIINLTTENRTLIAYACSHVAMMYDYSNNEMLSLQGHKTAIRTLSSSNDGKWLLTADFEDDCAVIIWDTEIKLFRIPISTLFEPHGKNGLTAARISPNAKYIVTIGNEKFQNVYFWLWTYGNNKPDAIVELSHIHLDRIKEISFDNDFPKRFALTTDHHVVFFIWDQDKLNYYQPKIIGKYRRFGIFNSSIFIRNTSDTLTATTNGFVLVWNHVRTSERAIEDTNLKKKHIKSVKLQTCNITVILDYEGMIVTGNSNGRITFYDNQLKILYWCQNHELGSISSISFDLSSTLIGPVNVISETDSKIIESSNGESTEEIKSEMENEFIEDFACQEDCCTYQDIECLNDKIYRKFSYLTVNTERIPKYYYDNKKLKYVATDATIQRSKFIVRNSFPLFFMQLLLSIILLELFKLLIYILIIVIATTKGILALLDISNLKCKFILKHSAAHVTSLDAHPERYTNLIKNRFYRMKSDIFIYSNYLITGNNEGILNLYDYEKRSLIISKKVPNLPDFKRIFDYQNKNDKIIYISCPQTHQSLTAITVLKYSPTSDLLICGMENGTLWVLNPLTLELLDEFPYKHSSQAIRIVAFTKCSTYMAYSDDALSIVVFRKNDTKSVNITNIWNLIGKCHSHSLPIRQVLFGPSITDNSIPRLFSLGEDQDLIEYDLKNSGPYPDPGLQILQIDKIESKATPLYLEWYPRFGVETLFVISNSEYKYILLNDIIRMIRGTFLNPTFGAPIQRFKILTKKHNSIYMVFSTDKEIGLQSLPLDGNPYTSLGLTGHPCKITGFTVDCKNNIAFTMGYKDSCVLMWKIKFRSINIMKRLGGEGLSPFYNFIKGGKNGWLFNEMRDLFYYAQILQQGENTMETRKISDVISIKQIPNLMRAVGYFPSNKELENIMCEVAYRNYAETGQLLEEINFEDFVKLYINHRPAFGYSTRQVKKSFAILCGKESNNNEDLILTRDQFMNVLFGKYPEKNITEDNKLLGEPLTLEEAYTYLKLLIPSEDANITHFADSKEQKISTTTSFNFLPSKISYKDFVTVILGVEFSERMRAENKDIK
ncbi:PREDICTED: WD repeat-containing protein 66-like [Polistes dominula]|uniref:Cilia- and flagella-associated protein 251 n=1 Tax=Polistes dominula TaxID=743375 RepID=A0ABM1IBD0_POLDO|nr:PREDICTED: WD repeat-containing protein 66-like [Polistes dominula]